MGRNERQISWREELLIGAVDLLPGRDLGPIYAARMEVTLEVMKTTGQISSWRATRQNSADDRHGIDIWIETDRGEMPLSYTSTASHARHRRRKHPGVPMVYLRKDGGRELESVEQIRAMVEWAMGRYFFEDALSELQQDGEVDGWQRITDKLKRQTEGVDYVVTVTEVEVPFQVGLTRRKLGWIREYYPGIPGVFLMRRGADEFKAQSVIKEQVLQAARNYLVLLQSSVLPEIEVIDVG